MAASSFAAMFAQSEERIFAPWSRTREVGPKHPVQGMLPIEFLFTQLPKRCKVVVDSHSSSPAFSGETRDLLFALFKDGAIDKKQLIAHTAPPGEESMIEDIIRSEMAAAAFAEAHPEAAAEQGKKKKK